MFIVHLISTAVSLCSFIFRIFRYFPIQKGIFRGIYSGVLVIILLLDSLTQNFLNKEMHFVKTEFVLALGKYSIHAVSYNIQKQKQV